MGHKNKPVIEIIIGIVSTVIGGIVLAYVTSDQFRLTTQAIVASIRTYFTSTTPILNIYLWLLILGFVVLLLLLGIITVRNKKNTDLLATVNNKIAGS